MNFLMDTLKDCAADMSAKMSRTLMLIAAVSLGVGTFVMSIGSNSTASTQIENDMAATMIDQISVVLEKKNGPELTIESAQRARELDLVEAAGLTLEVDSDRYSLFRDAKRQIAVDVNQLNVTGVTAGYLETIEVPSELSGLWILDSNDHHNVALLGEHAARALGIPVDATHPNGYKIYLNQIPTDVLGVIPENSRADITGSILIPFEYSAALMEPVGRPVLEVRTAVGAAGPVSGAIREAVAPESPASLVVSQVATLDVIRTGVNTQLSQLGMTVGGMLLVLTTLLIANSMIVSVMARTAEIGLRRALGSSSTNIAQLFLLEGALIGMLGGLAGAAVGTIGSVGLAISNGWSPNMPWWIPIGGLLIGVCVGVLASLYPALSAARIDPATAIRVD